jgi:hypothetical protein
MNFDPSELGDEIWVGVDLVPFGLERRREAVATLAIRTNKDGRGFLVEGFETEPAGNGSAMREARIGPHCRSQSMWVLIANAAYALSRAKFDEV